MDREQEQDQDQDRDRMQAATRLTEAAVTQLFQGASTPIDVSRGQQIGKIVAELYSTIYAGNDVQSTLNARPSLAERIDNAPARSPILPRPTRISQSRPTVRPLSGSAGLGAGMDEVGHAALPAVDGANQAQPIQAESVQPQPIQPKSIQSQPVQPQSVQNEIAEEASLHPSGVAPIDVPDMDLVPADVAETGPILVTQPENPQDSLQALLSEIDTEIDTEINAGDPQEEAPNEAPNEALEERMAAPLESPESPVYPEKLQAESLEFQLASLASQEPVDPEIPSASPSPSFTATPLPNSPTPKAPSPSPVNPGLVVLDAPEKRRPRWRFWKR